MPEAKKADAAPSPLLCSKKETGKIVLMLKTGGTVHLPWQGKRVKNKIVV